MATVAVTCIKNGRTDVFGRPLIAGTIYPEIDIDVARSLWLSGFVSVADPSVFSSPPSLVSELAAIGSPLTYKFPGFTVGRLLASLVAGATATRVGLTVTVSATAHGIPSGTYDGSDFFFPGCPSLAAGWYPRFLYVSANSVQFSLPSGTTGSDFAGESIYGGLIYYLQTMVCAVTIPGGSLQSGSLLQGRIYRECSTDSSTKSIYMVVDNVQAARKTATTYPNGLVSCSAFCDVGSIRANNWTVDYGDGATAIKISKDFSLPSVVSMEAKLSLAGTYMWLSPAAYVGVVK